MVTQGCRDASNQASGLRLVCPVCSGEFLGPEDGKSTKTNNTREKVFGNHLLHCQEAMPDAWEKIRIPCPNPECGVNLAGMTVKQTNHHKKKGCIYSLPEIVDKVGTYCTQCGPEGDICLGTFAIGDTARRSKKGQLFGSEECRKTYSIEHKHAHKQTKRKRESGTTVAAAEKPGLLVYENRLKRNVTAHENSCIRQLDKMVAIAGPDLIREYVATLRSENAHLPSKKTTLKLKAPTSSKR
jgi:hypothetical protein